MDQQNIKMNSHCNQSLFSRAGGHFNTSHTFTVWNGKILASLLVTCSEPKRNSSLLHQGIRGASQHFSYFRTPLLILNSSSLLTVYIVFPFNVAALPLHFTIFHHFTYFAPFEIQLEIFWRLETTLRVIPFGMQICGVGGVGFFGYNTTLDISTCRLRHYHYCARWILHIGPGLILNFKPSLNCSFGPLA